MNRIKNFYIKILVFTVVFLFIFAWENIQAVKLGYKIEDLRKELTDIENTNKYLKKEIQLTLSPENLQEEAKKLDMVYPEPQSMIVVQENKKEKSKSCFARLAGIFK
ncbi:MAG: hypothetical protein HY746_03205 [Elusimicrobia bacterium]|nr:hypothetical protein [Elusimicrobiota bacterium]